MLGNRGGQKTQEGEEEDEDKTATTQVAKTYEGGAKSAPHEKIWDTVNLKTAAEKKYMIGGWVRSWRSDKGFGFVVLDGKDVFAHVTALRSSEVGIVGKRVVAEVMQDMARGEQAYRAVKVYTEHDYVEEKTKEAAEKAAEESVRAASKAKQKAEESRHLLGHMMQASMLAKVHRPPGLEQEVKAKRPANKPDVAKAVAKAVASFSAEARAFVAGLDGGTDPREVCATEKAVEGHALQTADMLGFVYPREAKMMEESVVPRGGYKKTPVEGKETKDELMAEAIDLHVKLGMAGRFDALYDMMKKTKGELE
jgi:cold shock CspA family protein